MDTGTLIAIAVAVLLGIGAVVVAARGTFAPRRPAFAGSAGRSEVHAGASTAEPPPPATLPLAAAEVIDLPVRGVRDAGFTPPGMAVPSGPGEAPSLVAEITPELDQRLRAIEERIGALERSLAGRIDELGRTAAGAREASAAAVASLEASQAAALDRLRADVAQALARPQVPPDRRLRERRAEVAADLYARVARLESAIAQVTNPILLPGEAYAPPAEFLPEALSWENWREVGERAFALADTFSAQRLALGEPTRTDVASFVTALRGALTRAIYPNLAPDATPHQLEALHGALVALAAELPKVRRSLETEYLAASGEIRPN